MSRTPDDEEDDLGLPAMDSETLRRLRYAMMLHWDDPAYVLGCFQWACAQQAHELGERDDGATTAVGEARKRADELLNLWQTWMRRYPELYEKRVARWTHHDELPLGSRLVVRLSFLMSELHTIANEVEYTDAFQADDQAFAMSQVALIRDHVSKLKEWFEEREKQINVDDAAHDPEETVQ
jgi:hypothetical protein